ncbi:MAG: alpha-galactosidase, partial [bacterium]
MTIPLFAQIGQGRLTVADSSGRPVLAGARASVVLNDGSVFTSEGAQPRLTWHVSPGPGDRTLRVVAEFSNAQAQPVLMTRMDVLQSATIPGHSREFAVTQFGWQSWSPAGLAQPVPEATIGDAPMHGPTLPASRPPGTTLAWAVSIESAAGPALLTGFASARHRQGFVSLHSADDVLSLTAWESGRVLVPAGGIARSEPVIIAAAHAPTDAWSAYARAVRGTGVPPAPQIPTGWCSWYGLGEEISESHILETLESLKRWQLPVQYVQIDDGYQTANGDWLMPSSRFPNGLAPLAQRVHEAGYRPGLWLAPFLVSEHSALRAAHPDWLVHDHAGRPLEVIHHWNASQFALDTTHPDALTWLRQTVKTITSDWGFRYLKIDFLYAAALPGRRHAEIDPVEAYRAGLEAIRKSATDAYILACGAPLLPSAGVVDGMRVGPDVKTLWPAVAPGGPDHGTLRATIRSVLTHTWTHQQLWNLDPDCAIVRGQDGGLTVDEVRTWLTVVALSGGAVMLGDDLRALGKEDIELLRRLLPPSGRSAVPVGPFTYGLPSALVLGGEPLRSGWNFVALFNWNDLPRVAEIDLDHLGLPRRVVHFYDAWEGTHIGPISEAASLPMIPPHGVRLV